MLTEIEKQLVTALIAIGQRPALYLGAVSMERLLGFISGFLYARAGKEALPIFEQFDQWNAAHYGIEKGASWIRFVRFYSADDQDAFEKFFHNFRLFLKEVYGSEVTELCP